MTNCHTCLNKVVRYFDGDAVRTFLQTEKMPDDKAKMMYDCLTSVSVLAAGY